jgi:hypothetical protein
MARPVTRSFSSASVASFKFGYPVCKGSAPASPPVWVDQPCSTSQANWLGMEPLDPCPWIRDELAVLPVAYRASSHYLWSLAERRRTRVPRVILWNRGNWPFPKPRITWIPEP